MEKRGQGILEAVILIILVVIIVISIAALLGPQLIELWEQLKSLSVY